MSLNHDYLLCEGSLDCSIARHDSAIAQMAALIAKSCPPVGENGSALAVTAPVEPGQRAGIPSDSSKSSPKPKRLSLPKPPTLTTGDLFPDSLPSSARSSKTRQTDVLSLALGALLLVPGDGICGSCLRAPCSCSSAL